MLGTTIVLSRAPLEIVRIRKIIVLIILVLINIVKIV